MKSLYHLLFLGIFVLSCSGTSSKEFSDSGETDEISQDQADSVKQEQHTENTSQPISHDLPLKNNEEFEGVYSIGEWVVRIVPAKMSFELYDAEAKNAEPKMLLFVKQKEDSTMVYTHDGGRPFRLEMDYDHQRGMYYEDDEQWEVMWLKPLD